MNNAGDESVAAVLETLHAMKPEKAKQRAASRLPPYRGTPVRAASTSSLVPRLRKPIEKPDALTRSQELQVAVTDLTQRLRDKSDQCDELHSCVSRLNKELRLSVDQASLLQHAAAEKDKEIQTLRAHVDDLYQVQQQLRAESLQSKAALTRRQSEGIMVLPPPPEADEMPVRRTSVALDETMECLRLELGQLEAQCQAQSSELTRSTAENAALLASMRQWHAMLSLPPLDADEGLHEALTQALAQDTSAQRRRHDQLVATCDAQRKELLAFRLEKALQRRCRVTTDSIYDLEAHVEALAAANAQLADAAQNEAARSELWATQCSVVQEALEALSDRWEASLEDERQAADEKLSAAHEHIEAVEQQLHDEARDHEAVLEAYAACQDDLVQAQEALNAATNHCEFVQSQLQKLQVTRCQARCHCCDESTQTTATTLASPSTSCQEDVNNNDATSTTLRGFLAAGGVVSVVMDGASVLPGDESTPSINSGDATAASHDNENDTTEERKQGPSPVKATSQWITVIEAMQANHELELDVLRSDVADALAKLAARDAEVDQLVLDLEASHCAAGKLRVDYDVAAGDGPWERTTFPHTPGGRLLAVACESFASADCESHTERMAPMAVVRIDDNSPPQEVTTALEARALEMALEELELAHADVESHRACVRDVQMQLLATESQLASAVETNHMQAEETAYHRKYLLPSSTPNHVGDSRTQMEQLGMHLEDLSATLLAHTASADATQRAMSHLQGEAAVLSTRVAEADARLGLLTSAANNAEMTIFSLQISTATQDAALVEANAALDKQTMELATCHAENASAHARLAALVTDHAATLAQMEQRAMQSEELSPVPGLQDLITRQEMCLATMAEEKIALLDHLRAQATELQQLLSPDAPPLGSKADEARPTLLLHQELVQELQSLVRTLQYDVEMYKATIATLEADRRVLTCEDDEWPRRIELSAEIRAPMATDDGDFGPWESDTDESPCLERRLWTIPETNDDVEGDESDVADTSVSPSAGSGTELAALRSELERATGDLMTAPMNTEVLQRLANHLDQHNDALHSTSESESEIVALLHHTQSLLTRVLTTAATANDPVATDNNNTDNDDDDDDGETDNDTTPDEAECRICCWDAVDASTTDIGGVDSEEPAPIGVVVVHIGSHEIQAGVVRSGTSPNLPDLRLLAKHVDTRTPAEPLLRLGAIQDFDAFEATLRRVFSLLQVAPPLYKMILLHKPSISPLEKERLVDIAIEHCHASSVNLVTYAQVALVAAGRHTGLVVDLGVDTLYVVPIFEDMVLEHAVVKLALASPVWTASETPETALDRLFAPDAAQCAMGVVTAILQVLGLSTPVIHGTLVRHIVLTGGPASVAGLADRLHRELTECVASIDTVPHPTLIQVHVAPETLYHGAVVHAQKLSSHKWITRADVRHDGAAIVHTKCF
ncbi:hypothetical protein SDRG_05228 [Saprolegnia diclina VS20]|uniref:Uncharacterized protein n=1 Tax=Saprolegnia diclina (strain VS20) TaxID=1156394 RepID=T0QSF7_SAPDV|nr:hypothetical protein SDRG_05228 [Saprolegnia diclina VS20]EQC37636.1 hypothetical protein SDRG_05228 [Saprolegnia diclina VS20]|eukprot:XP_008609156.1 hypothetical protein SDRG_05228 [Saprolegnia diclina VS20]